MRPRQHNTRASACADVSLLRRLASIAALGSQQRLQSVSASAVPPVLPRDVHECQLSTAHQPSLHNSIIAAAAVHSHALVKGAAFFRSTAANKPANLPAAAAGCHLISPPPTAASGLPCSTEHVCKTTSRVLILPNVLTKSSPGCVQSGPCIRLCQEASCGVASNVAEESRCATCSCCHVAFAQFGAEPAKTEQQQLLAYLERLFRAQACTQKGLDVAAFGAAGLQLKAALHCLRSPAQLAKWANIISSVTFIAVPHLGTPTAEVVAFTPPALQCSSYSAAAAARLPSWTSDQLQLLQAAGMSTEWLLQDRAANKATAAEYFPAFLRGRTFVAALSTHSFVTNATELGEGRQQQQTEHAGSAPSTPQMQAFTDASAHTLNEWYSADCNSLAKAHDGFVPVPSALGMPGAAVICAADGETAAASAATAEWRERSFSPTADPCASASFSPQHGPMRSQDALEQIAFPSSHLEFLQASLALQQAPAQADGTRQAFVEIRSALKTVSDCFTVVETHAQHRIAQQQRSMHRPPRPETRPGERSRAQSMSTFDVLGKRIRTMAQAGSDLVRTLSSQSLGGSPTTSASGDVKLPPRIDTSLTSPPLNAASSGKNSFGSFEYGSPALSDSGLDAFPVGLRCANPTPANDPSREVSGSNRPLFETVYEHGKKATTDVSPLSAHKVARRASEHSYSTPVPLAFAMVLCAAVALQQLLSSEAGRQTCVSLFTTAAYWSASAPHIWAPVRSALLTGSQRLLLQPVLSLDGDIRRTMERLQKASGQAALTQEGVVFFSREQLEASVLSPHGESTAKQLFPGLHQPSQWTASPGSQQHPACQLWTQRDGVAAHLIPKHLHDAVANPSKYISADAWDSAESFAEHIAQLLPSGSVSHGQTELPRAIEAYVSSVPAACQQYSTLDDTVSVGLSDAYSRVTSAVARHMPAVDSPAAVEAVVRGALLPLALLLRSVQLSAASRGPLPVTAPVLAEVQRLHPPLPWLRTRAKAPLTLRLRQGRVVQVQADTPLFLFAGTSNRDPVEFGGVFSSGLQANMPMWSVPPTKRSKGGNTLGCIDHTCATASDTLPYDPTSAKLQSHRQDSLADRVTEIDDLSWQLWGWLCAACGLWLWALTPALSPQGIECIAISSAAAASRSVLGYLLAGVGSAFAWVAFGREASLVWMWAQLLASVCFCDFVAYAATAMQPVQTHAPAPSDEMDTEPQRIRTGTENPSEVRELSNSSAPGHNTPAVASSMSTGLHSRVRGGRSLSVASSCSARSWTGTSHATTTAEDSDFDCDEAMPVTDEDFAVLLQPRKFVPVRQTPECSPQVTPLSPPQLQLDEARTCTEQGSFDAQLHGQLVRVAVLSVALSALLWVVSPQVDLQPSLAAAQVCMLLLLLSACAPQLTGAVRHVSLAESHPRMVLGAVAIAAGMFFGLPYALLQGRAMYVVSNALAGTLLLPATTSLARAVQQKGEQAAARAGGTTFPGATSRVAACVRSPLLPGVIPLMAVTLGAAAMLAGAMLLHTSGLCNWSEQRMAVTQLGVQLQQPPFACPNCPVSPPEATDPMLIAGACDGHLNGLLQQLDVHTKLMYHFLTWQNDLPLPPPSGNDVVPPQWHHPLRKTDTVIGVPVVTEDEDDTISAVPNFVNNAVLQVLRARELFSDAHVADDTSQFPSPEHGRAFLSAASRGGARLPPPLVTHSDLLSDSGLSKIAFNGLGAHMVRAPTASQVQQLVDLPGASNAPALRTRIAYMSDWRHLAALETRGGFRRMGACAVFDANGTAVGIVVNDVPHASSVLEGAWVFPGDKLWPRAKFVWRSSLLVGVTVMDHLTGSHMVANTVNAAVREALPTTHPLRRLLRPGDFMSVWINQGAIPTLLSQNDVLHRTLPFTRAGQLRGIRQALHTSKWRSVQADLQARGMHEAPGWLYPYGSDLARYSDVVRRFVRRYLSVYYTADGILADAAVMAWMGQLREGFPSVHVAENTFEGVVDTVTTIIVHESAHHLQVGRVTSYVTDPALAAGKLTASNMADVQSAMQVFLVASVTNRARPMIMANYDHLILKKDPQQYYAAVEAWGQFRDELCSLAHAIDRANAGADEDATPAASLAQSSPDKKGNTARSWQVSQRKWPTNGANPRFMAAGVSI